MGNMDYYLLSAKISGVKNIQKRIYLEFYKKEMNIRRQLKYLR